jgi:hypothetical protein
LTERSGRWVTIQSSNSRKCTKEYVKLDSAFAILCD